VLDTLVDSCEKHSIDAIDYLTNVLTASANSPGQQNPGTAAAPLEAAQPRALAVSIRQEHQPARNFEASNSGRLRSSRRFGAGIETRECERRLFRVRDRHRHRECPLDRNLCRFRVAAMCSLSPARFASPSPDRNTGYRGPDHFYALRCFRTQVERHWLRALESRGQRDRTNWERFIGPNNGFRNRASSILGVKPDLTSEPEARAQCGKPARRDLC
jgi:hypothetical protein